MKKYLIGFFSVEYQDEADNEISVTYRVAKFKIVRT